MSAETLYDVLHDIEYRKKWDSNVIETFDIARLTVNADVGYYSCEQAQAPPSRPPTKLPPPTFSPVVTPMARLLRVLGCRTTQGEGRSSPCIPVYSQTCGHTQTCILINTYVLHVHIYIVHVNTCAQSCTQPTATCHLFTGTHFHVYLRNNTVTSTCTNRSGQQGKGCVR